MEGLPCFVCSTKVTKPCVKCGFIWYCGDACREHDRFYHSYICQFERKYLEDGFFNAGTGVIMYVYPKRAKDSNYEAETKLCERYSENQHSVDALVEALGTCTEPNEYVRSDVANFAKWMLENFDWDKTIRKRIAEANRKKKLEEEKLKQLENKN